MTDINDPLIFANGFINGVVTDFVTNSVTDSMSAGTVTFGLYPVFGRKRTLLINGI